MWGYVGRRLVLTIPTLLGASIIVFAMVHLAPGDPIAAVLPVDASKEQVEEIKKAYGFDKPLPVQYLKWLGHVVTGDLGKSIATRRAVILDVRDSLANSLVLALSSSILAFSAGIARVVRSAALDVLAQEFVLALRAKGLAHQRVFKHVIKNAAPQIITVLGLQFGFQLGGSVLVEAVFSWPGTGYLLNLAIFQRDIPVLQGVILVLATFFVLLNLLVDVLQTYIDPRIARHRWR